MSYEKTVEYIHVTYLWGRKLKCHIIKKNLTWTLVNILIQTFMKLIPENIIKLAIHWLYNIS